MYIFQIATESSLSDRAKLEQKIEDLENAVHNVSYCIKYSIDICYTNVYAIKTFLIHKQWWNFSTPVKYLSPRYEICDELLHIFPGTFLLSEKVGSFCHGSYRFFIVH